MSKKVLSLVLALVMVLGTFGSAFAASFPDTVETAFDGAVDRLSLLEILKGYPDGSFKPENQITRAEFAAVAMRAKGLEDASNAAKGLVTGFTDVTAAHWASGYVGTAGRLGVINGVGNGLFAPEAPVKYEEAITMIVRALGYEVDAQSKGGYPYGYLIVANEIGLLDDVKGTQGAPATRGIVAQITDNALEIAKMIQVGFGTDAKWVISGSKEHGGEAQYLLHDLGVEEVKGYVTNNFRTKSTIKEDEVEIDGVKYDITESVDTDAVLGTGVTAWAKDDVVFSITLGFTIKQTSGKDITFDADQVLYDVVNADADADEVELYIADDKYDWANKATIYVNNEKAKAAEVSKDAYGRFVLNDEDEIEFAYLFEIEDSGLVTAIDKNDMEYVNLSAKEDVLALDAAEEIYVFNTDLSKASLEDIAEDTAVFYWIDADDNYYIIASDNKVEGNLDAVRVRDNRLTVAGTNVATDGNSFIFSSDDKEEFEVLAKGDFADLEDYVDENVVVYKDLRGRVLAVVTDTNVASSTVYGLATYLSKDRNPVLSVYTAEGKEVDYTFEDRDDAKYKATGEALAFNAIDFDNVPTGVYFKLNKDGEIKDGTLVYSTETKAFGKVDDNKYGTWGADRLYIAEDTVIIEAYDDEAGKLEPSVIKYANIINKNINSNNKAIVIREDLGTTAGNDDLALLIFTDVAFTARDDEEFGILTTDPRRVGSDYTVEIDVYGKGKDTYTLAAKPSTDMRAGDLIEFKLDSDGEVVIIDRIVARTARDKSSAYEVVSSKSGSFITTGTGSYRNTTDTVYYSFNKDGDFSTTASFSRLDKGSVILLMADDKELTVVMDITAYVGKTPVTTPTTGVVTYISGQEFAVTVPNTTDTFVVKVGTTTVTVVAGKATFPAGTLAAGTVLTAELFNLNNLVTPIATTNFIAKLATLSTGTLVATAGVTPVPAITEVLGKDTLTFDVTEGNFVGGDKLVIDGVTLELPAAYAGTTANDVVNAFDTLITGHAALTAKYTVVKAAGVMTLTEKTGKVDAVKLVATIETADPLAKVTVASVDVGVKGVGAIIGVNQLATLTMTGATNAGTIIVTFNDGVQNISKEVVVTAGQANTAVATAIVAAFGTELTNWNVTASGADVIFAAKVQAPSVPVTVTVVDK